MLMCSLLVFQARIVQSKTLLGRYFDIVGHFFTLYCVYKIFIVRKPHLIVSLMCVFVFVCVYTFLLFSPSFSVFSALSTLSLKGWEKLVSVAGGYLAMTAKVCLPLVIRSSDQRTQYYCQLAGNSS